MRIKKKTSYMLLAASAAAVVGVSAVSFAAWQGDYNSVNASANTGSAYLVGFMSEDALTFGNAKLVPWNQKESSVIEGVKVISDALPSYNVVEDYKITVTLTSNTTDAATVYYVKIDNNATATLSVTDDTADWTDWQAVTAGSGATFNYSDLTDGDWGLVDDAHIHVALDSSANGDMGKAFTFNIAIDKL